ncbi:ribonuclease E/G-like protein, chloroplastic isoform X2 [Elaeis guineensis]|uniref:ribonuclease E/G-like protein, chloroplastic isoform X2 n=1 Tax=Elaeis guineensis var. tenera TaxID=51953 RepID=UPI003C6D5179
MASLAPSFSPSSLSGIRRGGAMDLCEASHLFPLAGQRGLLRFSRLNIPRPAIFPYGWHWMRSQIDLRIALHRRIRSSLSRSPLMSMRNGDSALTCKGLCKVLWNLEADIADDYLIFITGDPVTLGCWEPEMAILLSPCTECDNLWKTEITVPCGIHFKYNYFIREEKKPSCDRIWRPGPEFSLSVPFVGKENDVIVVRDSWMRTRVQKLPVPSWGSWMVDINLPKNHIKPGRRRAFSAGVHEILRSPNGVPLQRKQSSVDCLPEENYKPAEKNVKSNDRNGETMSETDQPVEEPWLLGSMLVFMMDFVGLDEASHQDKVHKKDFPGRFPDAELLAPDDDHRVVHAEEPASTVILINSSVCTMQRIAVLEDGKLVELLLEPVKNNVQCDSIYLGVVTKLVPHMGGAFVDIGISRPSLMGVKHNREPFVYPFDHEVRGKSVNGSSKPKGYFDTHENDQSLDDDEDEDDDDDDYDMTDEFLEVDHRDDSLQLMHEDIDENEVEDEMDVSEAVKMNIHKGASGYKGVEVDFEENYEENGNHIGDGYVEDILPSGTEISKDSAVSFPVEQDLKDPDDTFTDENKWSHVRKGTKVIVQVVKEGLGTKGPALSAYPSLRSRFWILITRFNRIGVSKKIKGIERTRLKVIAKSLQPPGFGLTVRTVAVGHSLEELQKDLDGLLSTWKGIVEHAKSAALAAQEGVEGAVPVMLHKAMGQTLSVVQDYFNENVKGMVVDSPRTYHEITSYLQEIAPDLCNRVELYDKRPPIFDEYNIEEEINNILSKRVPLSNGGSLVIEQTEALVSIDVNGGHSMLGQGTSQEQAILDVNLAAAKQIARELRLRDIGGIIVVDFIDMVDDSNRRLVYEEMKKATERDRSTVRVSELSKLGLMEITRKRVRPSVTFMISEPCSCCHATGRVEALETSFSKIEREICRLLAVSNQRPDPENPKSWPRFVLRVDHYMCNYLTSGKRTKLAVLSSSLKVWILLKVARGFSRGTCEVKPFAEDKVNDEQQVAISRLQPTEARTYIPSSKLTLFPVKKWKTRGK